MGRPKRSDAKHIFQRIVSAASELFTANGFSATTMADIADLAGVSKQTVYRHFATKAGIFVEAFNFEADRIRSIFAVEAERTDLTPDAALKSLCKGAILGTLRPRAINLSRIAIVEMTRFPHLVDLLREQSISHIIGPLTAHVSDGQRQGLFREGDPALLAQQLFMASNGLAFLLTLFGSNEFQDVDRCENYLENVWPTAIEGLMRLPSSVDGP